MNFRLKISKLLNIKKRVFVSFDFSEDVRYKTLLDAWNANSNFDFKYFISSPSIEINSKNAGSIKSALTRKMMQSTHLLVIVGKDTFESDWVSWEIIRASQFDTNLRICAVKLGRDCKLPKPLLRTGIPVATKFEKKKIVSVLSGAIQISKH